MTARADSQAEQFEQAMKAFHARDFATAKEIFQEVVIGQNREMAHAARLHITMCERRLPAAEPELRTPDEMYHYAVGLITQRRLADAEARLRKALESSPNRDYVHYALGIARGLQGDLPDAARHIQRAIQLDPRNRSIARTDPDFLEFGKVSPVRELVFTERKDGE